MLPTKKTIIAYLGKRSHEISCRKRTSQAKLKANSQQDSLNKWKNHFQELIGKAPALTNDDESSLLYDLDKPNI